MKKEIFQNVTQEAVHQINKLTTDIKENSVAYQKKQIKAYSPFSESVNNAFSGYDEFNYLISLGLQEAEMTRISLVREIDFDLYITEKHCTNYDLMKQGLAPYAKDTKDGYIILHHIGQNFEAPFAELTVEEHARFGNSKLLHNSNEGSWRRDQRKEQAFEAERCTYWKMRAEQKLEFPLDSKPTAAKASIFTDNKDLTYDIKTALEMLFSQCSSEDLTYISSLAKNHLLIKEIGASSIDEFLKNTRLEHKDVLSCPSCGGTIISFYGTYQTRKERKQRFKCNSCSKVFSSSYNTIIQDCSFSLADWVNFIDCLYNGYSTEKTAKLCNISMKTAFDNRDRLFFALEMLEEKVLLEGNIAIDETYILQSYKGNHILEKGFSMPRKSRKRGSENHTPGLSKNQVCIVCALDEYGVSIAKVAGLGAPSAKRLEEALTDHISAEKVKLLHSDASPAIRCFAKRNAFPIQQSQLKTPKRKGNKSYETIRQIQRINAYHTRLKKFLRQFNGVSSENLQGYVSLFSWRERNRDRDPIEAYKELLVEMAVPNKYIVMLEQIEKNLAQSKEKEKKNNHCYFKNSKSEEKTKEIYALYAQGVPIKEIAKKYNCTPQAITRRIRNYRAWGFGYKTQQEIRIEEANKLKKTKTERMTQELIKQGEYFDQLLIKRQTWLDESDAFYADTAKQLGRSKQTIKNDIATAKRIAALRETFYAGEEYEYMSLQDLHKTIYNLYNELRCANPTVPKSKIYQQLANQFKYTTAMIFNIISSEEGPGDKTAQMKKRTPVMYTLNRDRSVFIDYLNWTGSKREFLTMAAGKYQVSASTIQHIIKINYIADPNRYEMAEID